MIIKYTCVCEMLSGYWATMTEGREQKARNSSENRGTRVTSKEYI